MTTVILYHHVRKWQKLSNQVLLGTARVSVRAVFAFEKPDGTFKRVDLRV